MALLTLDRVTKRFGGLLANNNVSFEVVEGEILGLIGPNGAGKSTLFEQINGFYPPTSGRIEFQGHSLVGLRPDQVNRLGIGRTFQKVKPFLGMTVAENVMVAAMQYDPDPVKARRDARAFLEIVDLADKGDASARALSIGERRSSGREITIASAPPPITQLTSASSSGPTKPTTWSLGATTAVTAA